MSTVQDETKASIERFPIYRWWGIAVNVLLFVLAFITTLAELMLIDAATFVMNDSNVVTTSTGAIPYIIAITVWLANVSGAYLVHVCVVKYVSALAIALTSE